MENTLLLHDTKKKQFKLLKQFPKKNRKFTNKYFLIILKSIVIQYVVTDYNINSYRNITNHNFSLLHFTVNME